MNIIITGATGFIGKQLIPLLNFKKNKIYLFGRDIKKLNEFYPKYMVYEYKDIEKVMNKESIILHLAVKNNDKDNNKKYLKEFQKVNVIFAEEIYRKALQAKSKIFINLSTVNIFSENKKDPYSITKRKLMNNINSKNQLKFINLILPIVYGSKFSGKLNLFNIFPSSVTSILMTFISAFKPTMNIKLLADHINRKEFIKIDYDMIIADDKNDNIFFKIFKKSIDIFFSLLILIFFCWLILIISLLIKISSNGSIIFAHERVGKNNVIFNCYKFRTMKLNTKVAATHKVSSEQVTFIGKILRKTKLDEIPQVINVLKGDMSFIGPRPCLPLLKDIVKLREKYKINTILPGITGLAQVNGIDMSNPNKLIKTELQYFKLRSILSEIKIIILTLLGRGSGDKIIK